MISPWPQFQTPDRDRVERDAADQLDRLPADRVEGQLLVDREVRGHPRRCPAVRRLSPGPAVAAGASRAGRSTGSAAGEPASAGRRPVGHSSRTVGTGGGHRVELLEPAHPVAPQDALELGVALAELALGGVHRRTVQRVVSELGPDLLAGQCGEPPMWASDRLLDLAIPASGPPRHRVGPLGQVLGDAVGPHPHRRHRRRRWRPARTRPRPAWPVAGRPGRSSRAARPAGGSPSLTRTAVPCTWNSSDPHVAQGLGWCRPPRRRRGRRPRPPLRPSGRRRW